jgi:hypothetical protein
MTMSLLSIGIGLASVAYLWVLGFSNILPTLGWSAFLLPVAWIGLWACAWLKAYARSVLSFVLMLFGFIVLNHAGALVFRETIPTVSILLFTLPIFVVWLAFVPVVTIVTKKPVRFRLKEGIDYFSMWFTFLGMWAWSIFFPLWHHKLAPSRLLVLMSAPTLLYASLLLLMFLRIPREEFEYLMNAPIRIPKHAKGFRRVTVLFLLLAAASLWLESFRGMWWFALLGCLALILLTACIYRIYRVIFMPLPQEVEKPARFHFPLSGTALLLAGVALIPLWFLMDMIFN